MDILDVEINQKNYIKILSICLLLVILIIGIYYAVLLIPKSYTLEKETKVAAFEEEKDLVVHIDVLSPGRIIEIAGYSYCFMLSPVISLGAVPHHHLALSVKELTYSSNS